MKPIVYLLKVSAIGGALFLLGRSTVFISNLDLAASPIWFPAGIALAVLLLGGNKVWTGVTLGSFLLGLSLGAAWTVSLVAAVGTTLSAIVGQWLLCRVGWNPAFNNLRDAIRFLALAVVLSPTVNATISALNACMAGLITWSKFEQHWLAIWLGDGLGILVIAPLLLAWLNTPSPNNFSLRALSPRSFSLHALTAQWRTSHISAWRILEALIWFTLLLGSSWAVFYAPVQPDVARYPLEYLPISLVVWATLRFGPRGTVLSSFVVSCVAFWGLAARKGLFLMDANDNAQQAVYLLQAFVGITAGTALMLAATVAERQQAEVQLRFAAERERLLTETAQRIRRSLDLDEILNTTVAEIRQLLQADRVFITRLDLAGHKLVVAESVHPKWPSVVEWMSDDKVAQAIETLFKQEAAEQPCRPKPIRAIDDTEQVEKPPLIAEYYRYCQVRASIGVPIMGCNTMMFGILLVNQCSGPRQWQPFEINLLEQLATQVEIAIQQGQLYQHLQTLTASLEEQVQERTAELQQRMQELQGLNQVKDVLLHAVAHDLRTPVQGMLMVLNNLRRKHCDVVPVPCAKFDRMIQSCDHQLNLLNSLLEDHTSDKSGMTLDCQPIHLQHVLTTTLTALEPLFSSSQVTLDNQVTLDLPSVKADPLQVQHVFENLLMNAVKHNPPGLTVTINAALSRCADGTQPMIYCTVADDGLGMSQAQCDRLFHLYVRGVDNQHLTGIGLGLYRCRQIVKAHGGEIGVNSHPGKGSQFWFTLPAFE